MTPPRIPTDIADQPFDLIVVGAGINGAGIARDAAMRGLRVLVLDKGDIASGTTSWSTRLIHGGLRYLEHGEVGLVRESLRERERLLRAAPHLVKPLPLLIPIYEGDRRGPLTIRAGMVAYDILSFDKSLDGHKMLSQEESLARVPGLNPWGLKGAAVYYDAQVEYAERLAIENALSARAHGAVVLTYARVDRLLVKDGAVCGVAVTDVLDGDGAIHTARAPVTINVAGPWVDRVLAGTSDDGTTDQMIGGTKGSHIVVESFPGAPVDALYVEARRDGRPYFVVPWNDQFLIGTTDTRFTGDLDRVVANDDEIDYLIAETNRVLPGADLTRADVTFTYAGVRPLPYQAEGREGAITRRHIVHDHAPELDGFLSIVGGKLTTYRNLAQQAVKAAYKKLGRPAPPARTAREPLPGGGPDFAAFRRRFAIESGLPPRTTEHLLRVYGVRAADVLARAAGEPDLLAPFSPATGALAAEVVLAFEREGAVTLADALLRRTMAGLGPDVAIGPDQAAAAVAQRHLGWTEERAHREIAAYRDYVSRFRPRALDGGGSPSSEAGRRAGGEDGS